MSSGFDLTEWTLKKRTVAGVVFFILFVAGLLAYQNLPRAEDPGFVVRQAIILTEFPGASATRVEELVTDTIEEGLQNLVGLDYVESVSRAGQSVITVVAEENLQDVEAFWDEMRERVAEQSLELPEEAIGPMVNDDFGDVYGTLLALTGDGFNLSELEDVAEDLRRQFLRIPDVAKVQLIGRGARRIFLEYNEARLAELGLSAQQLARSLQARNTLSASGRVLTRERVFELQTEGSFESLQELGATLIQSGDRAFPLRELVRIRQGVEDDPAAPAMYFTGRPAVGLAVSMNPDGKLTELGPRIREMAEKLVADLPVGLELHLTSYQTAVVEKAVDGFVGNLMQSVVIVLVVMLAFLGPRTGLIVGAMVPMTVFVTFAVMGVLDIGIDKMSLTALIIALGLLVDNGIVMSESVLVKRGEGENLWRAAVDSARELRVPLLISSVTTVAALLPTYLAESTTGEYTSPIAEVVTIALVSSWVLSLSFVPLCCVAFMGSPKPHEQSADTVHKKNLLLYRKGVSWMIRHRWVSLAGAVLIFAGSMVLMGYVPQQFFPGKSWPQLTIELELPEGTPQRRTEAVVLDIESFFERQFLSKEWDERVASAKIASAKGRKEGPGLVSWSAFVGQGAPRFVLGYAPEQPRENYAYFIVNAENYESINEVIRTTESYIRERFPEALTRVLPLRNGPPLEYPVEIRLSGSNIDILRRIVRRTEDKLRSMEGLTRIGNDWGPDTPKVRVDVDPIRLQSAGLTNADVAQSLETGFRGQRLTVFRDGTDIVPIELRRQGASGATIDEVDSISVFRQQDGGSVPLLQVAQVTASFEAPVLKRRDRQRTITVRADIATDAPRSVTAFSVAAEMQGWLDEQKVDWPFGYEWAFGGEVESSGKANASIQAKQPIAVLLIILCLVFQFNTLREPLIVLLTLPFSITGVAVGLFVTQKPFGFMALLGVIALFGIVINNAIVLLDRVQIERSEGKTKLEAILNASERRLRPILLTTATTVAGLMPLAVSGGPLFSPMAVALMSGLMVSTLLTLGLVPVLYAILHRLPKARPAVALLVLGVSAAMSLNPSPARAAEVLTADEAARRAAAASLAARTANAELEQARAERDRVVADYVPRLGAEASYRRLSDIEQPPLFGGGGSLVVTDAAGPPLSLDDLAPLPGGGGAFPVLLNQTSVVASLTAPLSGYVFELSSALSAANGAASSSEFRLRAARVRAAADARLAYYAWAAALLQVEVFEKRVEEAQERLRVTQTRLEAGRVAPTDVLEAESALARARLAVARVETDVAVTEERLRQALVDEQDAQYALPPGDLPAAELPDQLPAHKILYDEALEQRLELKEIQETVGSLNSRKDLAQARRYPVVQLFGNLITANPNPRFIPNVDTFDTTWEVGAQLQWSPNDVWVSETDARAAEAQTEQARVQLESVERAIHQEVVEARRAVQEARVSLDTARRGLSSAEAAYEQRKLTYEEGAATLLDLLQSENALVTAELDAIRARIQSRTALVRLRNATGRDVAALEGSAREG